MALQRDVSGRGLHGRLSAELPADAIRRSEEHTAWAMLAIAALPPVYRRCAEHAIAAAAGPSAASFD